MRTLAISVLSLSAAIFAACYLLPLRLIPALVLGLGAVGLVLLLTRRKWLRLFVLAFFGAAAGLAVFFVHAQLTALPAAELDGETRFIRAVVVDYPLEYDNYTRLEIRLQTAGLPHVKALLYDNDKSLQDVEPGQTIEGEVRLRPADQRYGASYSAYNARDIYLIANARGAMTAGDVHPSLSLLPLKLNHSVLRRIQTIFPADTAPFFQALLLGDKAELYQDKGLHLALSRAGLMHVVAVSGMHIAFLVGLLQTVLGKQRGSSCLCILIVWVFVLMTGAGPSAVRAGIMQTMLLLAPLFGREDDPLTSFSAALGTILLLNPYAAASVSLQLSFASVAGICCFAGRLSMRVYDRAPELRETWLGRTAVGAVVNSLSVMPFTIPLMALHFGYVPLLSPVTNLLCLWLVSLCFSGACLACAAGFLLPVAGGWIAWVLSWPARGIFLVARAVSALPFAAVYLDGAESVGWLVLTYALFIGFHLVRVRPWLRWLIPAGLSAAALAALLLSVRLGYETGPGTIAVLDVGQGQSICVLAGKQTLMIDCGGGGTLQNAGETAGRYLVSRGRERVDVLVMTHLDSDHCNGVTTLMEYCPVGTILLAEEEPDTENAALEELLNAAQLHGTELRFLREDSALSLGSLYAELYTPPEGAKGNDRCLCAVVSLGEYQMLVTGDLSRQAEERLLQRYPLTGLELLIAGHHGSKNASSDRLLGSIGAETAVISSGYNTYGHPAPEALERLAAHGYTVVRTDTAGTVEIRVNG